MSGTLYFCSHLFLKRDITAGMRRRSGVSFGSHVRRDIADHAETSSRRRNWYVNDTDLSQTSLQRLNGTYIRLTNLRRRNDVPIDT